MSHTQEPWRLGRFPDDMGSDIEFCADTEKGSGLYVLGRCNQNFPEQAKADARRIVACVNACAGVATNELEQMKFSLPVAYDDIRRQRDELASALQPFAALIAEHHKRLPDTQPLFFINSNGVTVGDVRRAVAAISKVSK